MHAVTTLFLWLCVGATAMAGTPQPCQSPNMTGFLSVVQVGMKSEVKAVGNYSYDSLAKKLRFRSIEKTHEYMHMNTSLDLDFLMLFEEGVFFEIDNKNQTCEKKHLHSLTHAFEVPSGAMHLTELVLGSASLPGEGLKMNVWYGEVQETKSRYSVSSTFSGCLPVSTLYHSGSGAAIFSNVNIVPEVTTPEDFTPPSFCEGVDVEETPEGTVNSFYSLFD